MKSVLKAVAGLTLTAVLGATAPAAATGETRAPAAAAPVGSTAVVGTGADSRSVERLYRAYFLREPDGAGLAHWNARRDAGVPLGQISEAFAGSAEFRQRYGALGDAAFVTLVYRNVLDRVADSAGQSHWTQRLAWGTSRGEVMLGFSDSEEFKRAAGGIGTGNAVPSPRPTPPTTTTTRPPTTTTTRPTTPTTRPPTSTTTTRPSSPPATKPTAPAGTYAFSGLDRNGAPIRWAPCSTVSVVANFAGAPSGAENALREALTQISAATRIPWVLEGTTDERYDTIDIAFDRPYVDLVRYGDRPSPVLVSWSRTWDDGAVGYGGYASQRWPDGTQYAITGQVLLNPEWRPTAGKLVNLMLHELGHVANLAHVDSKQVMYPMVTGLTEYQAGDKAGLAIVGAWDRSCPTRAGAAARRSVAHLDGVPAELTGVVDRAGHP